ncbi:CocE/NonD family hydrolase [Pirellula sp. SH-Sr6A]|uniref:CocE/NonD family hydrolase n=1 Tax=Pirellula sp. SH-Sr6A TaxID=1632865 RepID=UPI00197CA867|nr:CocE/NonD family hydrolase [Pirellula sp. SH-Sr6A]
MTKSSMAPSLFFQALTWIALGCCTLLPSATAISQSTEVVQWENVIRLHYDKEERMIPMRDGVSLFTAIYTPKDKSKTYPILMKRTPYSCAPYGPDAFPASLGPSEHFIRAGYIFVNQDVRGRFLSEGTFEQVTPHLPTKSSPKDVDESTDTYDTIQWLLEHVEGNNGRVGMHGISYPGFYCSAGMINAHPALRAVSPQAPVGDWYFDDFLHNGAFFLAHAYRWLMNNAQERSGPTTIKPPSGSLPSLDGYHLFLEAGTIQEINSRFLKGQVPFWNQMMEHPNRDAFWQKRAILPHLQNVAPAVMLVTGWYDAEDLYGSFKTYQAIEKQNPSVNNVLVVGPWIHGGWASTDGEKLGNIPFGSKTASFYRSEIELPFFERNLKDADHPNLPEATVFETGGNRWQTFDAWPPKKAQEQSWFFGENQGLSTTPPQTQEDKTGDSYVSDPAKPVPYTETITPRMTVEYMVEDQRFASRRPDVLVYQSPVLEQDVVVAGPIDVELWVTTTGTDGDFIVKLIDVMPDGTNAAILPNYQMMVRSEVMRGRFRNSFEHPEPFVPNEPAIVRFELQDVLHRFQKGHRMMVQIQSTWFPLVDRNPQKFIPNIFLAEQDDFQRATFTILRSRKHPSGIRMRVLAP